MPVTAAFAYLTRFINSALWLSVLALLLNSCENDLSDVRRVSDITEEEPVDISYGVTILFSDSAKTKAKLVTNEMVHHNVDTPFYECPKDVLMIFYDEKLQEERRVTSDYGIYTEPKKLLELKHNVVVTMRDGTVFKSEQLFWDDDKRIFYNTMPLTVTTPNGDVIQGNFFEADENFENRKINGAHGVYNLQEGEEF